MERQAKAALATCGVALATACVLSLLHRRKRQGAPKLTSFERLDLEQSNTGTGPGSQAVSETGRSSPFAPYEPYEPATSEPDLSDPAATDERWLATTERIVMIHESLRTSAAKEAAAQQHVLARELAGLEATHESCRANASRVVAAQLSALKREVAQLEAALEASEAQRAHDAHEWRRGLAWLLATGRLSLLRWNGAVGGR